MNELGSTESTPGLLKDTYGNTGLSDALKRKRKKLAADKGIKDEEEENDAER